MQYIITSKKKKEEGNSQTASPFSKRLDILTLFEFQNELQFTGDVFIACLSKGVFFFIVMSILKIKLFLASMVTEITD